MAVGSRPLETNRVLIFATHHEDTVFIESELADPRLAIRFVPSLREIVAALVDDPPPRPQILVADFDAMDAIDVLRLHSIREGGWFGTIIGLGTVPHELEVSLSVDRSLARPVAKHALRQAVAQVGLDRATTRMRKLVPPQDR